MIMSNLINEVFMAVSLELWKYLDDETLDMMDDESEGRLGKREPCVEEPYEDD